jgi:hypothetical protein
MLMPLNAMQHRYAAMMAVTMRMSSLMRYVCYALTQHNTRFFALAALGLYHNALITLMAQHAAVFMDAMLVANTDGIMLLAAVLMRYLYALMLMLR